LIAYSHCIAHGIDTKVGLELQKEAVKCGYWPLYTYDPRKDQPLELISKAPEGAIKDFELKQNRFALLNRAKPEAFTELAAQAQKEAEGRFKFYSLLSGMQR